MKIKQNLSSSEFKSIKMSERISGLTSPLLCHTSTISEVLVYNLEGSMAFNSSY
jgi:hypothetical protein